MAKKTETIVHVYDDFDGQLVDDGLAQTFDFTYEGDSYRIDLRPENADKFRSELGKWAAAAVRVQTRRGRPKSPVTTRPGTGSGRSKEELQAAREWLKKNGHEVSPRGRIKAELLEIFDAAHA